MRHIVSFLLVCKVFVVAQECVGRDYGFGGTVCVCNSTYCDRIDKVTPVDSGQYIQITSTKSGFRFKKETKPFDDEPGNATHKLIIDETISYQKIIGWGGAFTDSVGIEIKSLPDGAQNLLMESYFSDQGIEYNLCRVPIASTDFSTHSYSYDDGDEDSELKNFKLATEDFDYKIPLIKKASNLTGGKLRLLASAWTAPNWMKTNHSPNGIGFIIKRMYQAWANYYIKFLDEYAAEGVQFWGLTTGNEPTLALVPFSKINSVGWLPLEMGNWIKNNLGPTLLKSNHTDLKVIMLDDQRFLVPWVADIILADDDVQERVDGIGVHWYWDFIFPASLLTKTHDKFPDKFLLATEASNGYQMWDKGVKLGSWERGEAYSESVLEDVNNWVCGWIDWNLALNETGGPTYIDHLLDAAIITNSSAGEFYKQPMYYHLGHFSKFAPPDSVRIYISPFDKNVPITAFKRPDNGTTIVILNKLEQNITISINASANGLINIDLLEKSITTLIYW